MSNGCPICRADLALEQNLELRFGPTPERRLRGRRRMLEILAEREVARKAEVAKLTADLGRRPNAREAILIEQVAVQVVRCRALVARGGTPDAVAECTRLITRALSKLGLDTPQPEPEPPDVSGVVFASALGVIK